MNFLSDLKYGFRELFKGIFTFENYLTNPVYVSVVYLLIILLISLGMPTIIAPIYGLIVAINTTVSLSKEISDEVNKEPLSVEECIAIANKYKPSKSLVDTEEDRLMRMLPDVELPVIPQPVAKAGEHLFELLFRNQPTRIISAVDEKSAVELSNLSVSERNDLLGISRL